MDTDYIPTIRFEIQGIKRMVVQAMGSVGSELGANVELSATLAQRNQHDILI